MPKLRRTGTDHRRAARIREQAYADPATRCWRCGRTRAEHGRAWHAGHVRSGDPRSPVLPECAECNLRDAALTTNLLRRRRRLHPTRRWL